MYLAVHLEINLDQLSAFCKSTEKTEYWTSSKQGQDVFCS